MTEASTIFALSSGPGRAGVAVIRVSGSRVREALTRMASPIPDVVRRAAFRTVRHPESGDVLDRAVVLWFAAPLSETGEDVAEFQVHGGPAVVSAVLQALGSLNGCRMAEPGEFVRRAFYNGKINLAEIEGLADLIEAETDAQRRQAVAQSCGALSKIYEGWRARLVAVAALTEAAIDFSDEADVAVTALEDGRARASVPASLERCGRPLMLRRISVVLGMLCRSHPVFIRILARLDAMHRMLHAWQPSELSRLNDALARGDDPRAVLDAMSHALANKLLHAPTHALNHATRSERDQFVHLISQLYGLHHE